MHCPCGSGRLYDVCCKPFHQGKLPEHAVLLMRSRYAAYACNLPEYIIRTTHPKNPRYNPDFVQWSRDISAFCLETEFQKLEILESQETGSVATVVFVAHLMQNGKDVSFTEKSNFEKIKDRWLYRGGQRVEDRAG